MLLNSKLIDIPRWYGERFDLKDPQSWHPPEQTFRTPLSTAKGQSLILTVECWQKLLMRGNKQTPMHQHPFDLVRVQLHNPQEQLQAAPMWFIVSPARTVKPRGNSPGRSIGHTLPPRPPPPLIKRRPSRKKKTLQIA